MMYKLRLGKSPGLKYPKTFNEKIQWLKLHDHKPEYIQMVDKYEVKDSSNLIEVIERFSNLSWDGRNRLSKRMHENLFKRGSIGRLWLIRT